MNQSVSPVQRFEGEINLPPDKSISHRAALFAALASGESTIRNYSPAADPASTLSCLRQLGVKIERDGDVVRVDGVGRGGFQVPDEALDCGNSGTTMRLLTGIVAGAGIECTLTGDDSLRSRTMKRIIDPLRSMGCSIQGRDKEYAPLNVGSNDGVQAIRYPLPIASAQLKSCVLLAGLYGEEPTEVIEQLFSRDHTERLLNLETEPYGTGKIIRSDVGHKIPLQNYSVPGDFSAAAFWLVAGSIRSGSEVHLNSVGMNPSRIAMLHILKQMGADIEIIHSKDEGREPVADLIVRHSELKPIKLDPSLIPNCIDELPILMVAMCFSDGESVISEAEELRHKETDRLSAMAEILSQAGADITETEDGVVIRGQNDFEPQAASYPTYHDHRMAMSAAVLASASSGTSEIQHAECTAISYPDFWDHFRHLMVSSG
jgi:3-phosphoshikimate 1-carboxyvinyltransferase